MRKRLAAAIIIGTLCTFFCFLRLTYGSCMASQCEAGDFTWALRGAQQLLAGENPYHDPTLGSGNPYPRNDPLFYPLPALLVAMPFTPFPREIAGALFLGVSCGLLAFGLFRDGFEGWPIFLSSSFWFSFIAVQWSPLIVASALLPWLLPLCTVKPNIGAPVFATHMNWRSVLAAAVLLLASLLILPSWPLDWHHNSSQHTIFMPLFWFPGFLVALAVLRWRARGAWLLLLMSIVPQRPLYDQLPLWLVCGPRATRPMFVLSALSWISIFGWLAVPAWTVTWVVIGMYLPALGLVLWPLVEQWGNRQKQRKQQEKNHAR